ncbi:MAG: fumarylacetoacetate hydrolase family protein [Pseudomonadota bacterium]
MTLPLDLPADGHFVLRVWLPEVNGPAVARIDGETVVDITSSQHPTMQALLDTDDPVEAAFGAVGRPVGPLSEIAQNSREAPAPDVPHILAPPDLQAIKASGVTFASSMIERVIEEQAKGDPRKAEAIRARCTEIIGDSLSAVTPGSEPAARLKDALISEGVWSQYLEVGIGPDAEVFTKAQPMASVGQGASVGLHPISTWNNPEPEVVLAINGKGQIKGAALGNDVNLRDVEGRSALLLGKAKDNNAACSIGPVLRLFDEGFGMSDVETAELDLRVEGEDGFTLKGHSSMAKISRTPASLVAQTCGRHHQYPDGFFLFLGTLFAPTEDRDTPGEGFTHKMGDVVHIHSPKLGTLTNTVRLSTECPEWTFGTAALMRNLAARGLL